MSIVASTFHLKRRVDQYIWYSEAVPILELREILKSTFLSCGRTMIIGGMVRDLARGGITNFRSDVDLVIDAESDVVREIAVEMGAVRNAFGGYGIKLPRWKIDFWAFKETWAHTAGHQKLRRYEDLTCCTFFDLDAVLYDLSERSIIAKSSYVDLLHSGRMDVVLYQTPSVKGNLVRAIRRLLNWNLKPGKNLVRFLRENLTEAMRAEVIRTERNLYHHSVAKRYLRASDLLEDLLEPERRSHSNTAAAKQFSLPIIYSAQPPLRRRKDIPDT